MQILRPAPLTAAAFAPFGEVIETRGHPYQLINDGTTQRFHRLASVELAGGDDQAVISIFRAQRSTMPLRIKMLERHPQGSQAFIPLKANPFLLVVAPPGHQPDLEQLRAFITDGHQGINYRAGIWHHPLLACVDGDELLVVDREGAGNNCEELYFPDQTEILLDPNNAED